MYKRISEYRKLGTFTIHAHSVDFKCDFPVSLKFQKKSKHPPIESLAVQTNKENRLHVRAIYTISFPLFDFRWVFRFYRGGVYE